MQDKLKENIYPTLFGLKIKKPSIILREYNYSRNIEYKDVYQHFLRKFYTRV